MVTLGIQQMKCSCKKREIIKKQLLLKHPMHTMERRQSRQQFKHTKQIFNRLWAFGTIKLNSRIVSAGKVSDRGTQMSVFRNMRGSAHLYSEAGPPITLSPPALHGIQITVFIFTWGGG